MFLEINDEINTEGVTIPKFLLKFHLFTQRYKNVRDSIKEALIHSEDILLDLIEIKVKFINEDKRLTQSKFTKEVVKFLERNLPIAEKYVKENYAHDKETSSENPELLLTEDHCRKLHIISFLMKCMIPIISDYYFHNSSRKLENFNTYMAGMNYRLIGIVSPDGIIENKLGKFITARIKVTSYSDTVIWKYLENENKNQKNVKLKILEALVNKILYKLSVDSYPVSFIHASIKNLLMYLFRENFKLEYAAKINNIESSEGSTNFEKIERNFIRFDEAEAIIETIQSRTIVDDCHEYLCLKGFDENLLKRTKLRENTLQIMLINLFFEVDGVHLQKKDFLILIYYLIDKFKENGLDLLARIMLAYPAKPIQGSKLIKHRAFIKGLKKSNVYNEILKHYKFFDTNFLLKIISGIYYNEWSDLGKNNSIFSTEDINIFTFQFLMALDLIKE